MAKQTFERNGEQFQVCSCDCHEVGLPVRHFMSCCDVTYDKYLVNGEVDDALFEQALAKAYQWRKDNKLISQRVEQYVHVKPFNRVTGNRFKFWVCNCLCHREDVTAQHNMPCCDVTIGTKFITKDGNIDHDQLEVALDEVSERRNATWGEEQWIQNNKV